MPGSKKRRKKETTHRRKAASAIRGVKGEVTPELPPSGRILGVLVRSLGINHPGLQSKTAQRYFSGRLENRVKESSRAEVISAISETLVASVFVSTSSSEDNWSDSNRLAAVVDWHATNWDRFRAFLQPRLMRVYSDHLAPVWQVYLRLAAIDLAIRAAAHIHLSGATPDALEFLEWTGVSRRGEYLNRKRREAGVSIYALAERSGVSENAVEAWLYDGARPSDNNLAAIAGSLTSSANPDEGNRLLGELRRLYWTSDVTGVLGEFIGAEAVDEIVRCLRRYASLLCGIIDDRIDAAARSGVLGSLATLGAHSEFSETLLNAIVPDEPDSEWREDIAAAPSNWTRRVLAVNYSVHRSEVDALIRKTEGRLPTDWDVSNPQAYAHYQRSMELQLQGKMHEAMAGFCCILRGIRENK